MGIQFDGINNEIKSQTKIDFPGSIGIAGTLTYEDVTSVDSIGIITARTGVIVGSGVTLNATGVIATGVVTATSFSGSGANLTGIDLGAVTGATGDFSIADKIVHTGDTNTAIRFPAADTITSETGGSERFRIDSSGKLSTGDESAPDVGAGGLCLQKGSDSNKALTIKNTNIAHGVTTYDETDTYFSIGQSSGARGGVEIRGYTDATPNASADPAIRLRGIIPTDSDQTYCPLVFTGAKANGTGVQNISADRRIASFQNADGSRIVNVTGTGIVFGDTSPAASNALDDYEEGTYVPTTNTNLTLQSSYDIFAYIKIGRCCTIRGLFYPNNNPSGNYAMTFSLPFAAYNYSQIAGAGGSSVMHRLISGASNGVSVYVEDGGTIAKFYKNGGSGNWGPVYNTDWNSAMEIYIDVTYFTV